LLTKYPKSQKNTKITKDLTFCR